MDSLKNKKVLIFNSNERYILLYYDACQEFKIGRKLLKEIINTGRSINGYYLDWIDD